MILRFLSLLVFLFSLSLQDASSMVPRAEETGNPKHPLLKKLAESPEFQEILTNLKKRYSINLMWLNGQPSQNPYIVPGQTPEEVKETFLTKATLWSKLNPKARVNLWYDGAYVTQTALQNTETLVASNPRLHLRDIRDLPEVAQNPDVFSPKLPVYFRVDLARAIFLKHLVETQEDVYSIYGDLDMDPMNEEELFDEETLGHLHQEGIVMARDGWQGFENGFQMLSSHNKNLLDALGFVLIGLNLERAKLALQQGYFDQRPGNTPMSGLQQIVYDSYPGMFKYFYAKQWSVDLEIYWEGGVWIKYEPAIHGLYPFGIRKYVDSSFSMRLKDKGDVVPIPTKAVKLPPAGRNYDDGL